MNTDNDAVVPDDIEVTNRGDTLLDLEAEVVSNNDAKGETKKVIPIKEQADKWMETVDAAAVNSAAGITNEIAGIELAQFSMARASLLRYRKNPFVMGVSFKDIQDPFISIGEFLLICSSGSSMDELRRMVKDDDKIELRVLEFIDTIRCSDVQMTMDSIVRYTSEEFSARVHASPKEVAGAKPSESTAPGN